MEKGEAEPLLLQSNSGGVSNPVSLPQDDGHLSVPERPTDWKAPGIILGYKFMEGVAFYVVIGNLVVYLTTVFHETNAASASQASTVTGTTFFAPLLGAIVADSFLGRFWTVLICGTSSALGMTIITLSALLPSVWPRPCRGSPCPTATRTQSLVFSCGLYLVALGVGGASSSDLPLGAEQFNDENPADAERKSFFITLFFVCFTLGKLVSTTVLAWVQENVSWALGFAIGTLSIFLALGGFLVGTPYFRSHRPPGSPLKSVAQVLVASVRKMHLDVPSDSGLLYEVEGEELLRVRGGGKGVRKLAHTDSFSFLDKAATIPDAEMNKGYCVSDKWRLCTVTQVEELKRLLRLLPIWISCTIYHSHSQICSTFIEQGNAMDRRIFGSFYLPAASLQAFQVVCYTFTSLLYDRVLTPAIRTYTGDRRGLSLLQRIGVSHATLIVTLAVAAALEAGRLESVRQGRLLGMAWQMPQYFLLACSDALGAIGQAEFFYDQAPDSMKSICSSLVMLTVSMGSYLTSLLLWFITLLTTGGGRRRGWLPEDLNEGHLDYVFLIVSALSTLNLWFYLWCARRL